MCEPRTNNLPRVLFSSIALPGYDIEYRKPVSGYTVEKKARGRSDWTKANAFPAPDNEYTVINLPEGSVYEFRVMAVNDAGLGKPSDTTPPHTVRDPICKYTCTKLNKYKTQK